MRKLFIIFIFLPILTSCIQNKNTTDINTNIEKTLTTTNTEKTFTTTLTAEPTKILEEKIFNLTDISHLKDMVDGLTLRETEELRPINSIYFYNEIRAGSIKEKNICMPKIKAYSLDFIKDEEQKEIYKSIGCEKVYIQEDFFLGSTVKEEFYLIENNSSKFIASFENRTIHDLFISDDKIYFLIDSRTEFPEYPRYPRYKNYHDNNNEYMSLYTYDLESSEFKQIPNDSSAVLYEFKDRKICMNFNYYFWLEDLCGNQLSSYYDDYIPELDFDDSVDKFIFVREEIYPSEFCIINKDGSVFSTIKDHYLKYFNEDETLKEEYMYYESREYEVVNMKDFCYVSTYEFAYPVDFSGFINRVDPSVYLTTLCTYFLDKKTGEMHELPSGIHPYGTNFFKIDGKLKIFIREAEIDTSDIKFFDYIDYYFQFDSLSYELIKDDKTSFFIVCYSEKFLLYDRDFNLLEEIPFYTDSLYRFPEGIIETFKMSNINIKTDINIQ